MASDNLKDQNNYSLSNEYISKYAYIYKYDSRGNCCEKKLPGADPQYMVYDMANRLILFQDFNLRKNNNWLLTKYDVLGREIMRGTIALGPNHGQLMESYKTSSVVEYYQGGSANYGYSNNSNLSYNKLIKVLYYDSYSFITGIGLSSIRSSSLIWRSSEALDSYYATSAKGLLTGEISFLSSDQSNKSYSAFYYDAKGNIVQKNGSNHFNGSLENNFGVERYAYAYDFKGNLLHVRHRNRGTNSGNVLIEGSKYSFDHAGRLITTSHYLNSETAEVNTSTNNYNDLGQLRSKDFNGSKQIQEFSYNIRGWIKESSCEMFKEKLYYEKKKNEGDGRYNGNISQSEITYLTGGRSASGYDWRDMEGEWGENSILLDYSYDNLNQLKLSTTADYFEMFSEQMSYDKNGNIKTMKRGGIFEHSWLNGTCPDHWWDIIDDLTYYYDGNQLTQIKENRTPENLIEPYYTGCQDFKDLNTSSDEYSFDGNGNMTKDLNKNITAITYNYLNLPDTVQMANGHMATYGYDADGKKTFVTHRTAANSTVTMPIGETLPRNSVGYSIASTNTTMYLANGVYENGVYQRLLIDDGILIRENSYQEPIPVFKGSYYIKDHLGNNRVIVDDGGNCYQSENYYPFGMAYNEDVERNGTPYQDYLFGGKEFDRKFELNTYDFGARTYDASIGRWSTMDPMAEKYYSISPYAYCANNPVRYVDPDGKRISNSTYLQVLSNRTLIDKLTAFDYMVAKLSGMSVDSYTFQITGGDRYLKKGIVYSATHNAPLLESKSQSRHLREFGACGVDLAFDKKISYKIIALAAKSIGLRLDPGGKYDDNHFHLDLMNYKGKFEYESNNYIPSDEDFLSWFYEHDEIEITGKKNKEEDAEKPQLEIITPFNFDRRKSGDFGYTSSYWDTYDSINNAGSDKKEKK